MTSSSCRCFLRRRLTKANVNLADRDGVTPLQHARRRGYGEIEKVLVAAGAR